MRKFKVFGSCVGMQTRPLDDESLFFDGLLYDIDLNKDYSDIGIDGRAIAELPIDSICKYLNTQKEALLFDDWIMNGGIEKRKKGRKFIK